MITIIQMRKEGKALNSTNRIVFHNNTITACNGNRFESVGVGVEWAVDATLQ